LKIPGSAFFKKLLFDREYGVCVVSQGAPRKKKKLQNDDGRTQTVILESLKDLKDDRVEKESRIGKEIKKGKWTEEAGTLARALMVMLRKYPGRQDVILRVVTLLLTGQLHGEVVSEISDYVPVLAGGQLERFRGLMEKIREKTVNLRGNWKDLTPEGRKTLEKVAGQLIRKQIGEEWGPTMQKMGLAAPPKVTIVGLRRQWSSRGWGGEVGSVMFWNVNGLRARWAAGVGV
jgi:hypothetical protein